MAGKRPYSPSQTLSACLTLFCRAARAGLAEGVIADDNATLREGELFKKHVQPLVILASEIKREREQVKLKIPLSFFVIK